MIRESVTIQDVIDYLNKMLQVDPDLMAMFVVMQSAKPALGIIGLLNGLFGTIEDVKDAEGELKDKREAFEVEKTSARELLNTERDAFHKHIKEHDLHVLQGFIDKVKGLAKGGLLRVKDVETFAEKYVDDLSVEQDNVPDPPLTHEEKEAEAAQ